MTKFQFDEESDNWLREVDISNDPSIDEIEGIEDDREMQDLRNPTPKVVDSIYMELWEHAICSDDGERHLFGPFRDTSMPDFVRDNIRESIMGGAIFSNFEDVASEELWNVRENMLESLEQDGWTIDGVTDQLLHNIDGLEDRDRAERIARTETNSILNHSREKAYEEFELDDGLFYWTGASPPDHRQTAICAWLIAGDSAAQDALENETWPSTGFEGTNPNYGGEPVPIDELKELVQEAAELDPTYDLSAREWTPHINCRSTWVRHVEG